ncbi:ATP synthase subunit a [Candidatus Dependentiae bacterium Noda2021]|nr:ATP synthase subunit a [Candidatus Dependentiae bacterium Noda2021]
MHGGDLLSSKQIQPFAAFGVTHPLLNVNYEIVLYTWIILVTLLILLIPTRAILRNKTSVTRYLLLQYVRFFSDLVTQTLGYFAFNHFAFITALFTFIFLCNTFPIIPWVEEPTKDLNTALALGLISFFYTQIYAIKAHGFKMYIKEYFAPFFLMFPLHLISKISSIISISFRLWGNIFGGATVMHIFLELIKGHLLFEILALVSGLNLLLLLFFGVFEGFLQAFVFTMLTVTYLSIAIQHEEPDKEVA